MSRSKFLKTLAAVVFIRIPFLGLCLVLIYIGHKAELVGNWIDEKAPGFPNKF